MVLWFAALTTQKTTNIFTSERTSNHLPYIFNFNLISDLAHPLTLLKHFYFHCLNFTNMSVLSPRSYRFAGTAITFRFVSFLTCRLNILFTVPPRHCSQCWRVSHFRVSLGQLFAFIQHCTNSPISLTVSSYA